MWWWKPAHFAGKESEREITRRVDAFVKSMPLSAPAVRGLVVEIKEPPKAPELFAFGLVRLALAAKGKQRRLAVGVCFSAGVHRQARRYCKEACHLF